MLPTDYTDYTDLISVLFVSSVDDYWLLIIDYWLIFLLPTDSTDNADFRFRWLSSASVQSVKSDVKNKYLSSARICFLTSDFTDFTDFSAYSVVFLFTDYTDLISVLFVSSVVDYWLLIIDYWLIFLLPTDSTDNANFRFQWLSAASV